MRLIEAEGGQFIPVDKIDKVRHTSNRTYVYTSDGEAHEAIGFNPESFEGVSVVAAGPGFVLIEAWFDEDGEFVEFAEQPVIAWRVPASSSSWPMPVSLMGDNCNSFIGDFDEYATAVKMPDGKVVVPGDTMHKSATDWMKSIEPIFRERAANSKRKAQEG